MMSDQETKVTGRTPAEASADRRISTQSEPAADQSVLASIRSTDASRQASVTDDATEVESGSYASPPCFMHEFASEPEPNLSRPEVLRLLNELLEGERAGAQGVGEMWSRLRQPTVRTALKAIAQDESACCAMLMQHIVRLGGNVSGKTGGFLEKLRAANSMTTKIDLVCRGQNWVVRRIRKHVDRISDHALRRDLLEMANQHEANIRRCKEFAI